jgi:hypothetical protein
MLKAALIAFLALAVGVFPLTVEGAAELDPASLSVEQKEWPKAEFRFRLTEPEGVSGVEATADGKSLPVGFTAFGEDKDRKESTAYLFLIDRSDPKRAKTIEANKALVPRLLDRLEPESKFAVYAFASDLEPVAEFGATKDDVRERLKLLKAGGMATELYRDAIEAIKVLEKVEASRKALVIFSDGRAEDTTFTLEQVLAKAREAKVTIFAVGYAEAAPLTVHLQSLRRLAAETGGLFAEADMATKREPDAFTRDFPSFLTSGGLAVIDQAGVKPFETVTLEVITKDNRVLKHSYTLAAAGPVEPVTETPASAEIKPPLPPDKKKWMLLTVLGLVVVFFGVLLLALSTGRKNKQAATAPRHVYARLKLLDADGTEHVMSTTALRLGRGSDNDVTLRNDSISRHHAEIHRARDGSFAITDLGAGNGVLVNGAKVQHSPLKHEDIIELGEVRLRFLIA